MSEQQIPVQSKPIADDEIDLLALVKTMWKGRKTILLSVAAGALLGVFNALNAPTEYSASAVIVPQLNYENQLKLSSLSALTSLAGISNEMNQTGELSPRVYPQIISSAPFLLELMNSPLNFQGHSGTITVFDYFTEHCKPTAFATITKYTVGLPGVLIGAIKGKPKELSLPGDSTRQLIMLTPDQIGIQKLLEQLVTLELTPLEGYITLTARMPEALAAAQLAQKAQLLLQRYITEFKTEKTKANLEFIQGRYDVTKAEFEKAQVSLAMINDRNKNFTSGLSRIETDRIQTRYTIAFNVFSDLAKQLEQNKIQVKKETPAFAVVKPVTVPTEKSKSNRPMIVLIWLFLGGVIGVGIVFGRGFIGSVKKRWNEK